MRNFRKYLGLSAVVFALGVGIVYYVMQPAPFISLFPIEHYDQTLSHWINPSTVAYDKSVISHTQQTEHFKTFKRRYFGDLSPWNLHYIKQTLKPAAVRAAVEDNLQHYNNINKSSAKIGYGYNLRPLPAQWMQRLEANCQLAQFANVMISPNNRAITVNNTQGRELPTDEIHLYHPRFAGQGYPFDNLQASAIWAGTPLYVIGKTADEAWLLVQTPNFMAWAKSSDIATVDATFVAEWQRAAAQQLLALTGTEIPLVDEENALSRGLGYIGMVFPGEKQGEHYRLLMPVRDTAAKAQIHHVRLQTSKVTAMPLSATPHHFVDVLGQLIGRPYGWGSMYFYNDCASELKNLFTPFGMWLPINSSAQVDPKRYSVKLVDLSQENRDKRLAYLQTQGQPFLTLINDGGHVLLFLGNYANPDDPKHAKVALSYQNVWALEPARPKPGEDRRAIIGGSVLLPILPYYPEDPGVASDIDYKVFKLGFLNQ